MKGEDEAENAGGQRRGQRARSELVSLKAPRLRHPVSEYSNSYLRNLNASQEDYRAPAVEDLYAIAETLPNAFVLWDGVRLRRTPAGQPTVADLIRPGDKVKSTFGNGGKIITTGPYIVVSVSLHEITNGITSHSLLCHDAPDHPHFRRGESYLNEFVAIDGRILGLFQANDGEVHLLARGENFAGSPRRGPQRREQRARPLSLLEIHARATAGSPLPPAASPQLAMRTAAPAMIDRACELKNDEFCDGVDVRKVLVRASNRAKAGAPCLPAFWCQGCRRLMNGSFRYPTRHHS